MLLLSLQYRERCRRDLLRAMRDEAGISLLGVQDNAEPTGTILQKMRDRDRSVGKEIH